MTRCGGESRAPRRALVCIAALMGLRAVVAAQAPLAFDEAYYWLWSKSLAAGYLDHPPLIAYVIRLGTTIFGDTPLGVRAVPLLLLIGATWAVWRSGAVLLRSDAGGAMAAVFFNVTLMSGTVGLAATPDSPAMAAAAFFVFCLAQV
ncbi:MAG TPA: glycosyltransferase family 39 protein, partial [Methylomirabilota bacterium]|nr:glycosyltransferase family 39 protein [Methylomirabilota bacterium]